MCIVNALFSNLSNFYFLLFFVVFDGSYAITSESVTNYSSNPDFADSVQCFFFSLFFAQFQYIIVNINIILMYSIIKTTYGKVVEYWKNSVVLPNNQNTHHLHHFILKLSYFMLEIFAFFIFFNFYI